MSLPISGQISFSQIKNLMQTNLQNNLSDYRPNGSTKTRGITGIPVIGSISFSHFFKKKPVPVVTNLIAKYSGDSWDGSKLVDETGSGYNATELRDSANLISKITDSNGNSYIQGNSSVGIRFPTAILPSTYTIFFITKYNGVNKNRIITGIGNNWLSGHWSNRSGVAYHEGWLMSPQNDSHQSNWFLSTDQKNLYRSNGISRVNQTITGTNTRLTINHGQFTEYSDWAFYCLYVYNRELSSAEITSMETYIRNLYNV